MQEMCAMIASGHTSWGGGCMIDLSGKVAFVTGAGKGIGRDVALGLARAGAAVLINDIDITGGAVEAAEQIRASGGRAIAYQADVASVTACRALVACCVAEFGR